MVAKQWLIAPDLDGPISGGTLYNRQLGAALGELGVPCSALDTESGLAALARREPGTFWVDSLYLPEFGEMRRAAAGRSLGLVAHYLPSLLRWGEGLRAGELEPAESFSLRHADRILVPSAFMARTLERLGVGRGRLVVVEPGRSWPADATGAALDRVRALVVANLTANKGVQRLLAALAGELEPDDQLELVVIGSLTADSEEAARCRRLSELPLLAPRVELLGELPPPLVAQHLARANLLLSASRMESYGMALAEARAAGLPIVACRGGNTAALVGAGTGGELVDDERALARACVALCRSRSELARRAALARAQRLPSRPWSAAGRELLAQLRAMAPELTA